MDNPFADTAPPPTTEAPFLPGTLWCGLAGSFESLRLARIVTGLFGGGAPRAGDTAMTAGPRV